MWNLTTEDCDLILQKYLTEKLATARFQLILSKYGHSELIITTQTDQKFTFFVKKTSSMPKILDEFEANLTQFRNDFTPRIYLVKSDLVVFENLKHFEKYTKFFGMDRVKVVLKVLARFHAASFAFEDNKSKINKFRLDQEYPLLHLNYSLRNPQVLSLIASVLNNQEQTQVFEDLEARQFSVKYRKSLSHGNLMAKHILFRCEAGSPVECKLIDLKSNFYAPPIYDVLQLIFFNTSEELRQHHFQDLLKFYYDSLGEEISKYGFDIIKILTLEEFFGSSHYFLPLIILERVINFPENSENLDELKQILNCPLLSKNDCYEIIRNKIGCSNYEFLAFEVTPLNNISGFLGEYFKLEIHIKYQSEDQTITGFIKTTPKTKTSKLLDQEIQSFSREVFYYKTLVPQMLNYGIQECQPELYFQRFEDLIVFENTSVKNYQNLDARKPLTLESLKLVTKKLAKFHSCSILLEEQKTQELKQPFRLLEKYPQVFKEFLFLDDTEHLQAKNFKVEMKSILQAIEQFPEIKNVNFDKYWPELKKSFYENIKPSSRFRNLLAHGDLWTSNILMKFEDNKPIDCLLIDFQIIRCAPPGYDLLSLLHLTTDRSTRLNHEDDLLKIYYDELSRNLQSYGISVDNIFTFDDILTSIKFMRPHMLMLAAMDSMMTMCTTEEISSLVRNEEESQLIFYEDRGEFVKTMCAKSQLYKNRVEDCLLDIYDYCNSINKTIF